MKISVALAAYNGGEYIAEQLTSILGQLGENDEVIVSDDRPDGSTKAAVLPFIESDGRVRYFEGPGKGVIANFESALRRCTGDVIFLSDQDDVWLPGKVERVMREFEGGAELVLHDASVTDSRLNVTERSYFALHGSNASYLRNIIKNSFVGCCMAFTREVMLESLPFPEGIPMHDWWIALVALKRRRKVALVCEPLILWRRHGDNVTGGNTTAKQKLLWRLRIISALLKV